MADDRLTPAREAAIRALAHAVLITDHGRSTDPPSAHTQDGAGYSALTTADVKTLLAGLDAARADLARAEALADQLVRLSNGYAGAEALNLWREYYRRRARASGGGMDDAEG